MLPRVWKEWNITRLCFEVDTEEYARERDVKITEAARQAGARTLLWDPANRSTPIVISQMLSMCFLRRELTEHVPQQALR